MNGIRDAVGQRPDTDPPLPPLAVLPRPAESGLRAVSPSPAWGPAAVPVLPSGTATIPNGDRKRGAPAVRYGNHTNCGLCRKHSPNCWCILWPAEIAGDRSDLCHEPDAHARLVQPGGILTVSRTLSEAELERIARRWIKRQGGIRNAHRVKLLGRHPWPWWKRAYYRVRRWLA